MGSRRFGWRLVTRLTVVLLPAIACTSTRPLLGKEATPAPNASVATAETARDPAQPSCEARSVDLRDFFLRVDAEGDAWNGMPLVPSRLPAHALPHGPQILLDEDELVVDRQRVPVDLEPSGNARVLAYVTDVLTAWRQKDQDLASMAGKPPSPDLEVLLFVAPGTPAWRVAAVLESARAAGARRVHFVVRGASSLSLGAPVSPALPLATAKDRWDVAAQLEPAFGRCPRAMKEVHEVVERTPSDDWARLLAEALEETPPSCGCAVDFAEARSWIWALYGRHRNAPLASFAVDLAPASLVPPKGAPGELVLVPSATWANFWDHLRQLSEEGNALQLRLIDA